MGIGVVGLDEIVGLGFNDFLRAGPVIFVKSVYSIAAVFYSDKDAVACVEIVGGDGLVDDFVA